MRETVFSETRIYRYTLWREWNVYNPSYAMFIGLNPSTADEVQDDPTVRRCIRFAKDWGFGALCMMNAFAYRATDPEVMKKFPCPVGPDNDYWLVKIAMDAGIRIAAWGVHGSHRGRNKEITGMLPELKCLGVTKEGHPKHPLYLSKNSMPKEYLK